ncbi:DoxX family protein [Vibrio coralliilyticus]|uniref:DoxX subfamily protein n=1 Tax=Vibrio coralliilyticus TaxID=190893 RepID=A0AAN0VX77_9VIBR|nr:DoxX family protein [Vibrio coralliilyticus]AIW19548.1 DoxX subfamily protein [Vibrio coralliilyticus]NOH39467.1 DoxX family protein [Vibrio coralliilyticus]
MKDILNYVESHLDYPDLGKLILRVSFSLMFLLHGAHKIYAGTDFIQGLFLDVGLPAFFAYGVYLGEVVAPILIILGIYTRLSSVLVMGTCVVVIGLMHTGDFFSLNQYGAWAVEDVGTYLFASIGVMLLGSGRHAVKPS